MNASALHDRDCDELLDRLVDEFTDRLNRGESADVETYAARHPELAPVLADVLRAIAAMHAVPGEADDGIKWDPHSIPERIGKYRILRLIARGGMGVVYEAEHCDLRRRVALKVLSPQLVCERTAERFAREARAVANLHHTHIVTVYESGVCGSIRYIAMQYVPGRSLESLLRDTEGPATEDGHRGLAHDWREVARLVEQAAGALAYAHSRSVLHRDIKPSNLLFDSSGNLWVADFGLAKLEEDELTGTGEILGTLRYMAPERLRGRCDARSDVYSLGATMYEMLTRRPLFAETDRIDLIRQVADERPTPPRSIDTGIPRDLETITLKALAKDPADRYASAGDMAGDLRLFLDDLPITARPCSSWDRLRRWRRRNPALAALTMLAMSLVLLLAGVSTTAAVWLADSRREALSHLRTATRARDDAVRNESRTVAALYDARVEQARASVSSPVAGRRLNTLQAVGAASELIPRLEDADGKRRQLRNLAIRALARVDVETVRHWDGDCPIAFDDDLDDEVRWDQDARELIVSRSGSEGEVARFPGSTAHFRGARLTSNGRCLVAQFATGQPRAIWDVWDVETGKRLHRFDVPYIYNGTRTLDFSADGQVFAVLRDGGLIQLFDPGRDEPRIELRTDQPLRQVRISPDGQRVAAARSHEDGTAEIEIWDLTTRQQTAVCRYAAAVRWVSGIAWSHDGRFLASGVEGLTGNISLWEAASGERVAELVGHEKSVRTIAFLAEGRCLVSSSWDGTTRVWDVRARREIFRFDGDLTCIGDRAFAVLGYDGRGAVRRLIVPGEYRWSPAAASAIDDSGRLLATADESGVELTSLGTGRAVSRVPARGVTRLMFRPGALFVQSANGLERWPVVHLEGDMRIGPPEVLAEEAYAIDASLDGTVVAVMTQRGPEAVIGPASGDGPSATIHHPGMRQVSLSPDGRVAATATWLGRGIRVWDACSGTCLGDVWPDCRSASVRFSPDGRWLAAFSGGEYRFWRAGNREPLDSIENVGRSGNHGTFAFSADGRFVAVVFGRGQTRLFAIDEACGLRELARFETTSSDHSVEDVALSHDGELLIVTVAGGGEMWDLSLVRERLSDLRLDWLGELPDGPLSLSN